MVFPENVSGKVEEEQSFFLLTRGYRFVLEWSLQDALEHLSIDRTVHIMKALIVDDSSFLRRLICDAMKRLGFKTIEAHNGAVAIEIARREKPAIILMDMIMPKMDGYEATRILKTDPVTASIPIIAITSQTLPDERKKAEEAGCDAFFEKPYNFWELRATIKELIS